MIPKSGIPLSEKIMLNKKIELHPDSIGMEQAPGWQDQPLQMSVGAISNVTFAVSSALAMAGGGAASVMNTLISSIAATWTSDIRSNFDASQTTTLLADRLIKTRFISASSME